jgi:hypothetical protein
MLHANLQLVGILNNQMKAMEAEVAWLKEKMRCKNLAFYIGDCESLVAREKVMAVPSP